MATTVNIPSAASTTASMTDYGVAFSSEYLITILTVVLGLTVAALAINWVKRSGVKFLKTIFGGGRKRRRR